MQDYSNVSAQLGDIIFQIDRNHMAKQQLLKRQRELMLEMEAAQAQEKTLAEKKAKDDAELKSEQIMPDDAPVGAPYTVDHTEALNEVTQ